jgi:hypothetical protein
MQGRYLTLTPDIIEKAEEYVKTGYQSEDEVIPTIVGLARYIGTTRQTIYNWAEADKDFFYITEKLMGEQEFHLINKSLNSDINTTISKLILGKHGYHDKTDSTVSAPDGGPVALIERVIVDPANTKD